MGKGRRWYTVLFSHRDTPQEQAIGLEIIIMGMYVVA
jgi:hypothetical protein